MFKKTTLLAFILPLTLLAASPKQRMLDELSFVKGVFEVKYAPLEWKRQYAGFNLDREIGEAICKVDEMAQPDTKEYHHILKKFFNATKDYHVGVHFYATEEASLPFLVRGAKGRFFVVYIDRTCLPYSKFPFSIGDEILSFDNRPVGEVIDEIKRLELGDNTPQTDQIIAEMMLTNRRAENGDCVPSGCVEIVGQRKGASKSQAVNLQWCYYPERIRGFDPTVRCKPNFAKWRMNPRETVKTEKFFERMMIYSGWNGSHVGCSLAENKFALGARSSFIPRLGKKVWSAPKDSIFDAYSFRAGNHLVGYIRIPHYMGDEEEMVEFCKTMKILQCNTDALVIDQVNNPGGSIFYLYSLVAALTEKNAEVSAPKHRLMLTQEEVYMAISILDALEGVKELKEAKEAIGETLGGYPVSMETVQLMRQFCDFVLDQWSRGEIFTEPTHLFGVDKIRQHPDGVYTKPILLLTNSLDFSAGDFFPAMLQDAGRATILGTRTAGAGGYVVSTAYPNETGVASFNLTGSIAERIDKQPIENLGVKPDIEYELTAFDFQNNYAEYVDKIIETVLSII